VVLNITNFIRFHCDAHEAVNAKNEKAICIKVIKDQWDQ